MPFGDRQCHNAITLLVNRVVDEISLDTQFREALLEASMRKALDRLAWVFSIIPGTMHRLLYIVADLPIPSQHTTDDVCSLSNNPQTV